MQNQLSQSHEVTAFLIGCIAGALVSYVLCMLMVRYIAKLHAKSQSNAIQERELKDPANWWKYDKDPYEYEYLEPEDD